MRFKSLAFAAALAALTLGGTSACSNSMHQGHNSVDPETGQTTVKVQNISSSDMDIFVVREGGLRIRLGMATANSTTTLRIPDDQAAPSPTQIRFVADPIGGNHRSVSESILVTRGDEITLQIPAI